MNLDDKIFEYHSASGFKKWWLWLLVGLGVLATIIFFYMNRQARLKEIASTYTEIDKLKLESDLVARKINRERDELEIAKLRDEYDELDRSIKIKERTAQSKLKELDKDLEDIKALKSWADLDEYNKSSRS